MVKIKLQTLVYFKLMFSYTAVQYRLRKSAAIYTDVLRAVVCLVYTCIQAVFIVGRFVFLFHLRLIMRFLGNQIWKVEFENIDLVPVYYNRGFWSVNRTSQTKNNSDKCAGTLGNVTIGHGQTSDSDKTIAKRAKRYSVKEYSSESGETRADDDYSEEDENFQFKDQAELEKVVEEGYGKDYEDGKWEDPNAPPSGEEDIPEDYGSADYEDKRAEEDSGSAADTSASVEYSASEDDSPDFVDSVEPPLDDKNFLFSVGSIFGDRMLLDAEGFPMFDNKYGSSDLRSVWAKKDKSKDNFKDYANYYESEARTSHPQQFNTTTGAPSILQASNNSTSNSTNTTLTERIDKATEITTNSTGITK